MSQLYPEALKQLISTVSRLPGIGRKSAERLCLAMYKWDEDELQFFGRQLSTLHERVKTCVICGNFADGDECPVCLDKDRDRNSICVVETVTQIAVIEESRSYNGLYHVLGGRLSPLEGIGAAQLNIRSLTERVEQQEIKELILATSPDFEGEATATYIKDLLSDRDLRLSRIALGIPVGADLSYADSASMAVAIETRREL